MTQIGERYRLQCGKCGTVRDVTAVEVVDEESGQTGYTYSPACACGADYGQELR